MIPVKWEATGQMETTTIIQTAAETVTSVSETVQQTTTQAAAAGGHGTRNLLVFLVILSVILALVYLYDKYLKPKEEPEECSFCSKKGVIVAKVITGRYNSETCEAKFCPLCGRELAQGGGQQPPKDGELGEE